MRYYLIIKVNIALINGTKSSSFFQDLFIEIYHYINIQNIQFTLHFTYEIVIL